jgi:hypothetical protein
MNRKERQAASTGSERPNKEIEEIEKVVDALE